MHLKRMKVDMKWPVARKGNKFVIRPAGELETAMPLLIVLRDMLKIGRNRNEIKQILNLGNVEVNGKVRKNDKFPVKTFDIIKIKSLNKSYSIVIGKSGRFTLVEKKDSIRIGKVIGKRMMKKGIVQISLNNGANFNTKDNIKTGESVAMDVSSGKIEKVIPLKEGSKIMVIGGKHIGKEGKIKSIKEDDAEVAIDSVDVNINLENIMAI